MGKRREGFLTEWQENYVLGNIHISEDRQRIEDHYILKSWEKAADQFGKIEPWLIEKGIIKASEGEVARKFFFSLRGKKPAEWKEKFYSYEITMLCPICDMPYVQNFLMSKNKVKLARGATMGVDYDFLKKFWGVEVIPKEEKLAWVESQIKKKRFGSLSEVFDYALSKLIEEEQKSEKKVLDHPSSSAM